MNRTEVPITTIEAAGPIAKDGKVFVLPVIFVLENGERVDSNYDRARLRDVKAFAATLPAAPENPMSACFHDGRLVGTKTEFYIGPR